MSFEEEIEELERKVESVGEVVGDLERRLAKPKRDKKNERYFGVSIVLAITLIISYQLVDSSSLIVETFSICVFALYLLASAYLKLDFRLPLITAIFLLVFCAATLPLNFNGLANQGGIIAYYYLAVAVIGLITDHFRRSTQTSSEKQTFD